MKKVYKNLLFSVVGLSYLLGSFLLITMPEYIILYSCTLGVGVIGTVILCFLHKKEVNDFMNSKYGKSITSNFVGFLLLFFILCLVNYLAFKNPKVWDLGKRNLNSLSEQTIKVVSSLDKEVEFIQFSNKANKENIRNLLRMYQTYNSQIKLTYIDPELRPDLVAKHKVTLSPSVIVKHGNKEVIVSHMQELKLTNGIIQVLRDKNPTLCFAYNTQFSDTQDNGLTGLLHILKSSAFDLKVVDLLQVDKVPSECQVFSIWGIQNDFLKKDLDKIKKYYNEGGVLFISLSPMFNGDRVKELRDFISKSGLKIENDIVIDPKNSINGSKGSAPFISRYDDLGINTKISGKVFFPLTSSIVKNSEVEEMEFVSLASTSQESWAEKTILEIVTDDLKFDEKDIVGPVDVAAALIQDKKPRIIALGNSSLVTNKFYNIQTNFNYILNLFHWSVGEDLLTSVQAAVFEEKPVFIGITQKKVIFYFTVIASPLVFLLIAFMQYRRRRFA